MADLENVKIVDEEKQQPLLAPAPEEQKSDTAKGTLSNSETFTRVVLVLLLILNFVQWRASMIAHHTSEADEKESAVLKLQDQVRGLCLDRVSLLKSVEAANKLASLPNNFGDETLLDLNDFLSTTTIESEAISKAFKKVEKVLAEQNEVLSQRATTQEAVSHPHMQQDFHSVCDIVAF